MTPAIDLSRFGVLPCRNMTPERYHALIRGETRGPVAWLARAGLWWARWPYGSAIWIRNRLYDLGLKKSTRVPVPVVSVGNLTLGGTGKTPCVEYVARYYREQGSRVAIISRGYGVESGANDEAMLLEENLPDVPHLQDRNRVAQALTAIEELWSEVLVLDDGYQHRRLARDLDIVVVDATRPLEDEYLFPRGTLREPLSEIRRAGVIVMSRCDQAGGDAVEHQRQWLARRAPGTLVATTVHAPVELVSTTAERRPVKDLQGQCVGAYCGIGHPEAFRRTLTDLGAKLLAFRTFPDHHPYNRTDVEDLRRWAGDLPRETVVVTTQKDLVKLRLADLEGRPLMALRIGLKFLDGEEQFRSALGSVLEKHD